MGLCPPPASPGLPGEPMARVEGDRAQREGVDAAPLHPARVRATRGTACAASLRRQLCYGLSSANAARRAGAASPAGPVRITPPRRDGTP
jgi:hypothetical protein